MRRSQRQSNRPITSTTTQEVDIKRGIGFKKYQVSVVKELYQVGSSTFYRGKEDGQQNGRRKRGSTGFLIKATVAETRGQARRVQAEAKALKRLSSHVNVLRLLDSGVYSIVGRKSDSIPTEIVLGSERLNSRKLFCFLYEGFSSETLSSFLEKQRRNLEKSTSSRRRSIFASSRTMQGPSLPGFLDSSVILEIFRQMVEALSVLHRAKQTSKTSQEKDSSDDSQEPPGIIHMNLTPDAFLIERATDDSDCQYRVKLCGLGCAMDRPVPLVSEAENEKARILVASATSAMYRAPEMINLHMANELTDGVDVWALGCLLYELMFLQCCFEDHNQVFGIDHKTERTVNPPFYEIPLGHSFSKDMLELLERLLTFKPAKRPDLREVLSCIEALEEGRTLPPRKKSQNCTHDTASETSSDAASGKSIDVGDAVEAAESAADDEAREGAPDVEAREVATDVEAWDVADSSQEVFAAENAGCAPEVEEREVTDVALDVKVSEVVDIVQSPEEDAQNDESGGADSNEKDGSDESDGEMADRVMGLLSGELSDTETENDSSYYSDSTIDEELEAIDMGEMMRRANSETVGAEGAILLLGGKPVQDYTYSDDESFTDPWEEEEQDIGEGSERDFADKRLQEAMLCSQHAILNSIAGGSDSSSFKVYAASEDMTSGSESESGAVVPSRPDVVILEDGTAIRSSSPLDLDPSRTSSPLDLGLSTPRGSLDLNTSSSHSASWLEFDPEDAGEENLIQRTAPLVAGSPEIVSRKENNSAEASAQDRPGKLETSVKACNSKGETSREVIDHVAENLLALESSSTYSDEDDDDNIYAGPVDLDDLDEADDRGVKTTSEASAPPELMDMFVSDGEADNLLGIASPFEAEHPTEDPPPDTDTTSSLTTDPPEPDSPKAVAIVENGEHSVAVKAAAKPQEGPNGVAGVFVGGVLTPVGTSWPDDEKLSESGRRSSRQHQNEMKSISADDSELANGRSLLQPDESNRLGEKGVQHVSGAGVMPTPSESMPENVREQDQKARDSISAVDAKPANSRTAESSQQDERRRRQPMAKVYEHIIMSGSSRRLEEFKRRSPVSMFERRSPASMDESARGQLSSMPGYPRQQDELQRRSPVSAAKAKSVQRRRSSMSGYSRQEEKQERGSADPGDDKQPTMPGHGSIQPDEARGQNELQKWSPISAAYAKFTEKRRSTIPGGSRSRLSAVAADQNAPIGATYAAKPVSGLEAPSFDEDQAYQGSSWYASDGPSSTFSRDNPRATPPPEAFRHSNAPGVGIAGMSYTDWANSLFGDGDEPVNFIDGCCSMIMDDDQLDLSDLSGARRLEISSSPAVDPQQLQPLSRQPTPLMSNRSTDPKINKETVFIPELQENPQQPLSRQVTPSMSNRVTAIADAQDLVFIPEPQENPKQERGRDRTVRRKKKKKKKTNLEREMEKVHPDYVSPHPWAPRAFSPSTASTGRKRMQEEEEQQGIVTPSPPPKLQAPVPHSEEFVERDESPSPPPPPPPSSKPPAMATAEIWGSLRF